MKIYTFVHTIVGVTAMWMIRQNKSNDELPRNFTTILSKLRNNILQSELFKSRRVLEDDEMFFFTDERHVHDFVSRQCKLIPEFLELNLRKVEYDLGMRAPDVEDDTKRYNKLISVYSGFPGCKYDKQGRLMPEWDFISIHALVRNICNTILDESAHRCTEIDNKTA